jgi:hypothetical protein
MEANHVKRHPTYARRIPEKMQENRPPSQQLASRLEMVKDNSRK